MARALLSTLAGAAWLASSAAADSYQVVQTYDASNFFDSFNFWESHASTDPNTIDPTGGFVHYRNRNDSEALGMIGQTPAGNVYIGVDHTNPVVSADWPYGRNSVRVESKAQYKHGLFIFDLAHMPKPACGSWPAFWTYGNNWPYDGDIDIYENWNDNFNFNRQTLHTGSGCVIQNSAMTGVMETHVCDAYYSDASQSQYQGCSADDYSPGAWGNPQGGLWAVEWNSDHIKMWHFLPGRTPQDLVNGVPNPATWGSPTFNTKGGSSQCDIDTHYGMQKIVFNIDFCGVSGVDYFWQQTSCYKKGWASCPTYVAQNPGAFQDTYFEIRSVKIYQMSAATSSSSSMSSTSSTSSTSSSSYPTTTTNTYSTSTASTVSSTSTNTYATSSSSASSTSSDSSTSTSGYATSTTSSTTYSSTSTGTSYVTITSTQTYATSTDSSTTDTYVTGSTSTDTYIGSSTQTYATSIPTSSSYAASSTTTSASYAMSSSSYSSSVYHASTSASVYSSAAYQASSASDSYPAQQTTYTAPHSYGGKVYSTSPTYSPSYPSQNGGEESYPAASTSCTDEQLPSYTGHPAKYPSHPVYTTSTVYATTAYPITYCKDNSAYCTSTKMTTKTYVASTTVCTVEYPSIETPIYVPEGYTASTIYSASSYTVSSCESYMTDCVENTGYITTEMIPVATTVCPIEAAQHTGAPAGGSEYSPTPASGYGQSPEAGAESPAANPAAGSGYTGPTGNGQGPAAGSYAPAHGEGPAGDASPANAYSAGPAGGAAPTGTYGASPAGGAAPTNAYSASPVGAAAPTGGYGANPVGGSGPSGAPASYPAAGNGTCSGAGCGAAQGTGAPGSAPTGYAVSGGMRMAVGTPGLVLTGVIAFMGFWA